MQRKKNTNTQGWAGGVKKKERYMGLNKESFFKSADRIKVWQHSSLIKELKGERN
jgi:hypothetical protein